MATPTTAAASSPTVNSYHLTSQQGPQVLAQALAWLRPHLPVSLPIYRRLQFGRFFPATLLLTNLDLESHQGVPSAQENHQNADAEQEPWFITFLDRSCRPETEVWFFGSWESSSSNNATTAAVSATSSSSSSSPKDTKIDTLVRALLRTLKSLPLPQSIHTTPAKESSNLSDSKDSGGFSRTDYGGHIANPEIMLWGGVHEATMPPLQRLGVVSTEHKTSLMPNWTFVWDVDELARERGQGVVVGHEEEKRESTVDDDGVLPSELRWGELQLKDFALVRSRTQIPRQERTLAVLPNVGIFPRNNEGEDGDAEASPIAWVFVGLDSSLTTLHVEPEWRGRGLAKAITTKVFTEKMGMFWEDGLTKWGFGYVIVGNKQSEGMCRSLGGKSDYESFWIRVDLGKVQ